MSNKGAIMICSAAWLAQYLNTESGPPEVKEEYAMLTKHKGSLKTITLRLLRVNSNSSISLHTHRLFPQSTSQMLAPARQNDIITSGRHGSGWC